MNQNEKIAEVFAISSIAAFDGNKKAIHLMEHHILSKESKKVLQFFKDGMNRTNFIDFLKKRNEEFFIPIVGRLYGKRK